jgi:putative hydrolase of the HAD superfamily
MKPGIQAVAFDLDGTLYPNCRLYIRLLPFLLKEWRLLAAFGRARDIIRLEQKQGQYKSGTDFYYYQAQLTAAILKTPTEATKEKIDRLIYRGWEPLFKKVALFPHAGETLAALRQAGLKTGLLSDFPPETKLYNLGITHHWDAVCCSEETGALKPDPRPFACLAAALGCAPEQILYVGNSLRYDTAGARRAGMQTALITGRVYRSGLTGPDFAFYDYRQLRDYVLQ